MVPSLNLGEPPSPLFSVNDSSLELSDSLSKIDALMNTGKKICLFIGRTAAEKLPTETGEAQPDEVWISGDTLQRETLNKERIHVRDNFNDDHFITKLRRKFDLIVLDIAVIKTVDNDFAKRFSVMLRTPHSELIFEGSTGYIKDTLDREPSLAFDIQSYNVVQSVYHKAKIAEAKKSSFKKYLETAPLEKKQADWEAFIQVWGKSLYPENEIPSTLLVELPIHVRNPFLQTVTQQDEEIHRMTSVLHEFKYTQLEAHLKTLYEQVRFEKKLFPYHHNYDDHVERPYFVVSHPKDFERK